MPGGIFRHEQKTKTAGMDAAGAAAWLRRVGQWLRDDEFREGAASTGKPADGSTELFCPYRTAADGPNAAVSGEHRVQRWS